MGNPRQHTLGEQLRSPYLWHRWAGLVLAALLVWVAVTGMLLNHEHELGLGARPVRSAWLLDAWEVPEPVLGKAYRTRAGWAVEADGQSYLGTRLLEGGALSGALDVDDQVLVATRDALHLFTPDGTLIERRPVQFGSVTEMGRTADGLVAFRTGEVNLLTTPPDLSDLTLVEGQLALQVAAPEEPPVPEMDALRHELRARQLTWERVVRDLHAGHVPARWLRWVLDLVALGLIALALTGVWIHLQRRKH